MNIPQIESVTILSRNYKGVFNKLLQGPVFLANRSKPAAVLLSLHDYEVMANALAELKRLRRLVRADQSFQELKEHPDLAIALDEVERGFANA